MRSTIVLSLLTVVSITVASEASANSNGQEGINGQWSAIIPGPAQERTFSEPSEDMVAAPLPESPCRFWEFMVNITVGTFDWRRTALAICADYHTFKADPSREMPDSLEAAYEFLGIYQQAWKDRQVERDRLYEVWQALPEETPEREAARLEVQKLNFTDDTKKQMAEDTGLLLVLEAIENGY